MELYIVLFKQRKLLFKQHNTTKQSLSLSLSLSLTEIHSPLSHSQMSFSSFHPAIDQSHHR